MAQHLITELHVVFFFVTHLRVFMYTSLFTVFVTICHVLTCSLCVYSTADIFIFRNTYKLHCIPSRGYIYKWFMTTSWCTALCHCICIYLHARGCVKELVPSSRCSMSLPADIYTFKSENIYRLRHITIFHSLFKIITNIAAARRYTVSYWKTDLMLCWSEVKASHLRSKLFRN